MESISIKKKETAELVSPSGGTAVNFLPLKAGFSGGDLIFLFLKMPSLVFFVTVFETPSLLCTLPSSFLRAEKSIPTRLSKTPPKNTCQPYSNQRPCQWADNNLSGSNQRYCAAHIIIIIIFLC